MKKSIIKANEILYIVLVNICLGFKFYEIPYFCKYILTIGWCLAIIVKKKGLKIDGVFKRYLFPLLFFFAISILLILLNKYEISKKALFSRTVSMFIQKGTIVLFTLIGIQKYGKKVLNLLFQSLVINNIIGMLYAIFKYGIGEFIKFISNPFSEQWNIWVKEGKISNCLELHEVTLTLGLFFLLIIAFKEIHFYKSRKTTIICLILLLILGFKRIQVLALAATLMANYIILRKAKKCAFKDAIKLITIGVIIVSLAYVYLISNEKILEIANRYDINFMSRLEWYISISKYFRFSPLYMGQGWGSLSVLISSIGVIGVHSDILRMYFDAGFIGFVVWICYYFYYISAYLKRKDIYTCKLYLVIMIYTIVTYLTDNTLNYFVFQVVLLSIPVISLENVAKGNR